MSASARRVTVGTSPTRIDSTRVTASAQGLMVHIPDGATVYFGGADVDAEDGYPVTGEIDWGVDLTEKDELYGIVEGSPVDVHVLEVGV